jgi:hypothetical protein
MGWARMKEFKNIESFVEHLAVIEIAEVSAAEKALEKCALVVEKRAKEKVGEYQEEIGPFAAWAELADSTKADRERKGFTENDPGLRTGAMRDSIEHTTSPADLQTQIGSNDDKLVFFELGTSKQPPRSVLGGAMAEKLPEIKQIIGAAVVGAISATNIEAALLGEGVIEGGINIED